MKTLIPRTKSIAAKKPKKILWKVFGKTVKPIKARHFPEPPDTLDATKVIERNTKLERQAKLPVPVYFPAND
jgi:hypothetical protein